MMLHTKYQGSRHCCFRQDDFFMFSLYKPRFKTCDPVSELLLPPGVQFEQTW